MSVCTDNSYHLLSTYSTVLLPTFPSCDGGRMNVTLSLSLSVSLTVSLTVWRRGSHFWDCKFGRNNWHTQLNPFLSGLSCRQRARDHPAESMWLQLGLPEAGWINLPHSGVWLEFSSHMPSSLGFIINIEAILTSILFFIYLIFLATTPNMRLLSSQLNNTPLLWLDSKQVENSLPDTEQSVLYTWSLFIPYNSMIMTASILKRRKLKLGQVNTIIQDCSDTQLQLWGCNPNRYAIWLFWNSH